jgi:hypothetical protein
VVLTAKAFYEEQLRTQHLLGVEVIFPFFKPNEWRNAITLREKIYRHLIRFL